MRFDDSRWEFRGAVRIRFAGGEMRADQASIRFAGNRLAQAVARGAPAEFQQQLEGLPRPVQGTAATVTLDMTTQTVRLAQDAWLFDGRNEIRSAALVFDMRSRLARTERPAGATPGERVRITIRPEPQAPVPAATPPAETTR
jgi:lipopolysaccharide transport protein LptA